MRIFGSAKTLHELQTLYISFVVSINQIYNHLGHHVHFLRLAFSNHQGQCDQCVVRYALVSVCGVQDAVVLHEPKEERRGDTLVAVGNEWFFTTR